MILNDKQIRSLAEQGMITPFEPRLIREVLHEINIKTGETKNRKVISYGLSSYGYDLRLSPKDFRVFRHIPGTVVDPKRFNPANLEPVELQRDEMGDFFVMPNHSYGLGVALEKIKVPPNVTVVILGKSTYARCFSADTKVKLVDGDYTFLELIDREAKGETLWGYGVKNGQIVVQQLIAPRYIEDAELVEVALDNGTPIHCTADHVFLMRDGSKKQAQHLKSGDSLHAIYDCHSHGYPAIYDPVFAATMPASNRTASLKTVHRMVAKKVFGDTGLHVHHKDGNRFNNHPDNLELMTNAEHIALHNQEEGRHLIAGQEFARLYQEDKGFRSRISSRLHSEESKAKADANARWWKESEENKARLAVLREQRWQDNAARQAQSEVAKRGMAALRRREDITEESLSQALISAGTLRGAAKLLNVDRSVFRRFPHVIQAFKEGSLLANHKVKSVMPVDGLHKTYCLTAPDTGNFALSAGVFVNNCGLICNMTPGEAAWEGHLTLEFSNSSGADCRIYANEGVCQALFLEGEPCETSYADRSGKYQGQPESVVVARV